MTRVLRGGRSGGPLIPAIFRRRAVEGVAALFPRLGSSPAAAGRLMHTGFGGITKLPQRKALPFGRRGVLCQGQETMTRMERSRRSFMSGSQPGDVPWGPIAFGGLIGLALGFRSKK